MSVKKIVYHEAARQKLQAGACKLANAVKVTLGPRGRTVILQRAFGAPILTKDGVTVAKEIELADRFENLGAQFVREVAAKTQEVSGDGTTTATVLAQAMLSEGMKFVSAGAEPLQLKAGMDAAVELVVAEIARLAVPVEGRAAILQVATIAANNDAEIGETIAQANQLTGEDGVITVEDSQTGVTTLEHLEGMQLDKGYLSPYFVTDAATQEAILDEPYVLVCDLTIRSIADLVPLLAKTAEAGRALVVICQDLQGEALALMVVNKLNGTCRCAALRAPGFGQQQQDSLADIAALTGAEVVSDKLGDRLADVALARLGQATRVQLGAQHSIIVGGRGSAEALAHRVKHLQEAVSQGVDQYETEKLRQRLAKLTAGVTVIKVGAPTETELKERKYRIQDALAATRAAQAEGIIPGGGSAYVHILSRLMQLRPGGDAELGVRIVARALEQPLRSIAENAGAIGGVVAEKVKELEWGMGFDALTLEYVDMFKAGIIDPAKVARSALQNAASIASMVLTTEVLICENPATGV